MDIEEVVSLATIATLAPDDALQAIAQLVDYALDRGDLALTTKTLEWCDELESRLTTDRERIRQVPCRGCQVSRPYRLKRSKTMAADRGRWNVADVLSCCLPTLRVLRHRPATTGRSPRVSSRGLGERLNDRFPTPSLGPSLT